MEKEKYKPWNSYIHYKEDYTKEDAIRIVDEWVASEECGKFMNIHNTLNRVGMCVDGPLKGCVIELMNRVVGVHYGSAGNCKYVNYEATIQEKDGMCNLYWKLHSEYPREKEPKATFINPDFVYDPRIAEPLF